MSGADMKAFVCKRDVLSIGDLGIGRKINTVRLVSFLPLPNRMGAEVQTALTPEAGT